MRAYRNRLVGAALLVLGATLLHGTPTEAYPHKHKIKAVEMSGVKFWIPSVIVVKKGQKVTLEAQSHLTGDNPTHGLEIKAFKVKEVIGTEPKVIEFKAKKKGIFPINCHLHPAHVGGQLIVQ